jgi:large subunit ribosomal protein L17
MRHQKHGRKFGRKSASRHALFSNLVSSLIEHERIQTTDAKAKELRRIAERTITWATSVGNLVGENKKKDAADQARVVHAMRMAQRIVKHKPSLEKLFNEIGPRFVGRPGGYTRIMKLKHRHGDAAPISIIELVDFAEAQAASHSESEAEAPKGKKKASKAETAEAAPAKKAAPKKAKAKADDAEAEAKPAKKKAAAKKKSEE